MTVMRRLLSRVPSSCVSSIMGREPSYGFDSDEQMNGKKFPGKCQVVLLLIQNKVLSVFLLFNESKSADLTEGWCRDSFEQTLLWEWVSPVPENGPRGFWQEVFSVSGSPCLVAPPGPQWAAWWGLGGAWERERMRERRPEPGVGGKTDIDSKLTWQTTK